MREVFSSLLLVVGVVQATNITLNQPLKEVVVEDKGELVLHGNSIDYKKWDSKNLVGKVRILQHMAGRKSVKAENQPLMDKIVAAHFDAHKYQTTNIINIDDAIMGTGLFVKGETKKAKKEHPDSQVVMDNEGVVQKAWDLKKQESLIVVLDKTGKVRFVHEGKLSDAQMQQVLDLAKKLQQE
ncbi:YtfJ family protein [Helicobacter sp. NHP21005]|uniref:YtfJ family protein n=1 Tax=Helicobacter felistomachi TaxID=3040201 RepID=UPI002574739A|nr:YtfJ family protein [Helicobacter sp. NHP21005]BEG57861.1 YtfJ family protein [Helicobacter sp. NHP21005]